MKIGDNRYKCPWCGEEITHIKRKSSAPKGKLGRKGAVSDFLICPKCFRYVSQKGNI